MTPQERREILAAVRQRFAALDPYLTELSRRVWVAAEAETIGPHGNAIVAEATGISRTTITKARVESQEAAEPTTSRQRPPGGGRKTLVATDPTLLADLDQLIDPSTRGDPESPLLPRQER